MFLFFLKIILMTFLFRLFFVNFSCWRKPMTRKLNCSKVLWKNSDWKYNWKSRCLWLKSKREFTIVGHQQTSAGVQLDQILCLNNIVEPKVLGHQCTSVSTLFVCFETRFLSVRKEKRENFIKDTQKNSQGTEGYLIKSSLISVRSL